MTQASPDRRRGWAAFMLGRAWFEKGRDEVAREHLLKATTLWPELALAHRYLSYVELRQERWDEAFASSSRACELDTDDQGLHWELGQFRKLTGQPDGEPMADHPGGRLRFRQRYQRRHHRSGWQYATDSLLPLHNGSGVLFESFLEDPFAWQQGHCGRRRGPELLEFLLQPAQADPLNAEECGIIPFREPWVGFLHNPPGIPGWLAGQDAPGKMLSSRPWRDSLEHCVGLFTLSEYHAAWLREATGKPVSSLLHPTEIPAQRFDYQAFLDNPDKRIVQVGWWLRRLSAIYRLPIPTGNRLGFRKVRLVPSFGEGSAERLHRLLRKELAAEGESGIPVCDNTFDCPHLDNRAYDELLSRNLVFVQLYDASANNTVIECLARGTPLLVNPLPAVIEYLGDEYPLYYTSLEEAASRAMDPGRIRAAHDYLLQCPQRTRLGGEYFRNSMLDSEVYSLLEPGA